MKKFSFKHASINALRSVYTLSKKESTVYYRPSAIIFEMMEREENNFEGRRVNSSTLSLLLEPLIKEKLVHKAVISSYPYENNINSFEGYKANLKQENEIKIKIGS